MQKIKINPQVDPRNYNNLIEGTPEENIFCAFLGLTISPCFSVSAEQFLMVYIEMAKTVYAGAYIGTQPNLKDSRILVDIRILKGVEQNLLERSLFLKIVRFLSGENEKFCLEAAEQFTVFEAKLLVSHFMGF